MSKKAGHRSWSPRNAPVPGRHRGDIMSPDKRSALMSRIRGKNTTPEIAIASALREREIDFEIHARDLAGCPDIVLRNKRVAVFIDGSFWHGWRFPLWERKLTPHWRAKIAATRMRDQRNFRKLRRLGWTVLRIWEHQVEQNLAACVRRIIEAGTCRRHLATAVKRVPEIVRRA